MWRIGSPIQISNDINTMDSTVGVPPVGLDLSLLVDDLGDFLIDAATNKLTVEE